MNDRTRLDYGRQAQSWEELSEPVVSFMLDDGQIFGCPFFHLVGAQYLPEEQNLILVWPSGIVKVTGPKALEFYKDFAKGKGTWIKADGEGIMSVQVILPAPGQKQS
jgi:hypothetical protein